MRFLADNMSTRELRSWIACRSSLLQSSRTQAEHPDQGTSLEEQRKELAFMCHHVLSIESRNSDARWLPREDDPAFSFALEELVRATLMARQVRFFGVVVSTRPCKLSQAMWREIGEEFNDDDVLQGEYKER